MKIANFYTSNCPVRWTDIHHNDTLWIFSQHCDTSNIFLIYVKLLSELSDCHILESTCYQHTKHNQRDITIAIPSVSLSICPPVSLSYSDVTSKRLNVSLKFVRRPISPVTLQCESKKIPTCGLWFSHDIFWQTVENFTSICYTLITRSYLR